MINFEKMQANQLKNNPFEMIGSDWFLITAEKEGKTNTMTASWGAFGVMWRKNVAFTVIRPQRYTKEFVDCSERFSLSFFGEEYKEKLSYIGATSGRNEDKIEKSGLSLDFEAAVPYFREANTVMICKKLYAQQITFDCFIVKELNDNFYKNNDQHVLYISEIEDIFVKNQA